MSEFQNREKAFEKKFEVDEELKFKIASRSARLFGLWAAEQLGFKGAEADAYAVKVVETDLHSPGHDDIFGMVEKDLHAKKISVSRHRLEHEMAACLLKARDQLSGKEK